MSRLIDADAVAQYLHEFRCVDCDRRKGMNNGNVQFCYEIGDAPCHACDIGDTIEYFLDEDIAPTIDAIPVEWLREKMKKPLITSANPFDYVLDAWEQDNNPSPTCGPDYCDID